MENANGAWRCRPTETTRSGAPRKQDSRQNRTWRECRIVCIKLGQGDVGVHARFVIVRLYFAQCLLRHEPVALRRNFTRVPAAPEFRCQSCYLSPTALTHSLHDLKTQCPLRDGQCGTIVGSRLSQIAALLCTPSSLRGLERSLLFRVGIRSRSRA